MARGLLTEDEIDAAVRRILRLKIELGRFENPRAPDRARQTAVIGSAGHAAPNLEVARRSLVLIADDGLLPLTGDAPRRLAVLGPNADDPAAQPGDWAGDSGRIDWMPDGHPRETIETVLDGFRAVAPDGWQVTHARGADIDEPVPDPEGAFCPDGQPRPPVRRGAPADAAMIAEAVAAARAADVAVVAVGDTIALTGESRSTATLELQGGQVTLLDAVVATGTPTVVVLVDSKPAGRLPLSVALCGRRTRPSRVRARPRHQRHLGRARAQGVPAGDRAGRAQRDGGHRPTGRRLHPGDPHHRLTDRGPSAGCPEAGCPEARTSSATPRRRSVKPSRS